MAGTKRITVREPWEALFYSMLLPYQREDVLATDRYRWSCWARQTGKSFTKSLRRLLRGMARRRDQLFLSAGERQSRELMDKVRLHCEGLKLALQASEQPMDAFEGEQGSQLRIDLPAFGIKILGLPANPQTARGFTGDVFLDEFAMHRYDQDIWAAMFPAVMRGKGELDVASTPKGRSNLFADLERNDMFHHETITINDAIAQGLDADPTELKQAMGDEMLYRQEFLCEFVDEATAFLTYALIEACEDGDLPRRLAIEDLEDRGGDVVLGVDVGRKHDLTVIWALDVVGDHLASLGLIELSNVSFSAQFDILCRILECRCVRRAGIDSTGMGMQLAEQLEERFGSVVEGHTFTALSKEDMAGKLRVRMEAGNLRIPVDRRIREDLHSVEKSATIDGHIRLRAARQDGSHADRFWALALAVTAASGACAPVTGLLGPRLVSAGARDW